jgi:hypothetical protein
MSGTPEEIAAEKALISARERLLDINERLSQSYEDQGDLLDDQVAKMQEELRIHKLLHPEKVTELATLREAIRLAKEKNAETKESIKLGKQVGEDILGAIGLNKKFEDSMLGGVSAMMKSKEGRDELQKTIREGITLENIAYSLSLKVIQSTTKLAFAQDQALVSLNKQTGATKLYGDELVALESELAQSGVTSEEAGEAFIALSKNVYNLRNISAGARKELSTTTALLQEMGVSADATAGNVQFMTASLGMSVTSATQYQRELFTLAQQIGMPPAEMAEGFKSAAPKLAAFGKQAGKVFKKLAVNARAANMEVEQMLNIVEQFDTFEGAAQAVGKLNALLGGQFLNSMELVTQTDPTERMRMLSGALNDAGKSFDQMTYYEKKSIAAAAGLSDVNELALVMAGNFSHVAGGAGKSQAEIEKMADEAAEFQTIQDELNQLVRAFAIEMRPVIKSLKDFLDGVGKSATAIKMFLPIITGFISALAATKIAIQLVNLKIIATGTALRGIGIIGMVTGLVTLFTVLPDGIGATAAVLTALTAGLYLFAVAMGVVNVSTGGVLYAIGALVTGISYLIYWLFEKQIASSFLEGLVKIGEAFVNIGSGLLVAAAGFWLAIPAVLALLALTPALAMSVLPGGAFWTLSTGLGWIADALERLDEGTIGRLTTLFEAFANISSEAAESIDQIGESFLKLGKGMAMTSLAMTNPIMATAVMPIVAAAAIGAGSAAASSKAFSSDSPDGLTNKGGGSTKKAPPQDHTITLKFDDRGFEKRVIKIMNDQLNVNQG